MAKEIIWTKRAYSKFNKIIDYIEEEWGEAVTANFVQKSFDIIELLSERPFLGTLENPSKGIRGFLITKHNRLFYRFTKNELIILNFFDNRSNLKRKY